MSENDHIIAELPKVDWYCPECLYYHSFQRLTKDIRYECINCGLESKMVQFGKPPLHLRIWKKLAGLISKRK